MGKLIKVKIFYLFFIYFSIMCTSFSCKKEKEGEINNFEKSMIGFWKPTSLIINGVDTSSYLLSDSTCYPMLYFYARDKISKVLEINAGYDLESTKYFLCGQYGSWYRTENYLAIYVSTNDHNLGGFLANEYVSWEIVSETPSILNLKVDFHGVESILVLNKAN